MTTRPASRTRIAVDPNDGAIYVAELKDNPLTVAIAKYDKFGNFLSSIPVRLERGSSGDPADHPPDLSGPSTPCG